LEVAAPHFYELPVIALLLDEVEANKDRGVREVWGKKQMEA